MKRTYFLLWILLFSLIQSAHAANYGSDSTVSIVNPFAISGDGNAIRTFGCVKNGFQLTDASTTCSFYSIFPVAGPITLNGSTLYLNSDLILTNTGTLADLGSIKGQNHVLELAPYQTTFSSGPNASGARVFELVANVTQSRTVNSIDWSYDNAYVAVTTSNFQGASNGREELFVYQFNGSSLTLVAAQNIGNAAYAVRWHPSSYRLAISTNTNSQQIQIFSFDPITNTLTRTLSINTGATINSLSWNGRGQYLAAGGAVIRAYSFNEAYSALSTTYTPTNALGGDTVLFNSVVCAPTGNPDDILVGTAPTGNLHLYRIEGTSINLLKTYTLGTGGINGLDWARTSTYVAVAFASNAIKTYEHTASTNIVAYKSQYTTAAAARTVSWKPDASEIAAGTSATASANEFISLNFNNSTYALSSGYEINVPAGVSHLRYAKTPDDEYVARVDITTNSVNILKTNYSPFIFQDINLFLNSNITLESPLTFYGNNVINGRGNKITFKNDGAFNLAQGATLETRLLNMEFNKTSAFAMQGPTSKVIFRNSKLMLDDDFLFADGTMETYEDVVITGPHMFNYASNYTSTIGAHSKLIVENRATLNLGRIGLDGIEPLEFEDTSSRLNLDNATLSITNSGLTLKQGAINVYGASSFDINLTETTGSTQEGLSLGSGTQNEDVTVRLYGNGTSLELNTNDLRGPLVLNAYNQEPIIFYGQSKFSLAPTASWCIKRPTTLSDGWIDFDSNNSLFIDPAAYLIVNNMRQTNYPLHEDFTISATVASPTSLTLDNGGSIILDNGFVNQAITVNHHNNSISGVGDLKGAVTLLDANTSLTVGLNTDFSYHDLTLNGGTLLLENNILFSNQKTITTSGTISMFNKHITLGNEESCWTSTLIFDGTRASLDMQADVCLSGQWTFSGDCIINGNGYTLDLLTTGTIIVAGGSTLTIRNTNLINLGKTNALYAQTVDGVLILDNTAMQLLEDVTWKKGGITIINDSSLLATNPRDTTTTFSYISPNSSTISTRSGFHIYEGVNLSLGKYTTDATNQPLSFEDASSVLALHNGTLTIRQTGVTMTKGTLKSFQQSQVSIESSTYETAFILGDGTAENDVTLVIGGDSKLSINTGKLFYNNHAAQDRIIFTTENSIIRVNSTNGLTAKRNLTIEKGILAFPFGDNIGQEDDALFIQKDITHYHDTPYARHRMYTTAINPYLFPNTGYFDAISGRSSVPMHYTEGSGFTYGAASIVTNITVKNHTVALTSSLEAPLEGNIILNGGTLNLKNNLNFWSDKTITGSGTVDLNSYALCFGNNDVSMTNSLRIIGDNGALTFNSAIDLRGSWTFDGICTINGNGNELNLGNGGTITIRPNSTLILNHVVVKDLGKLHNALIFMDPTAQMNLCNTYVGLENNITSTNGTINITSPSIIATKNHNWSFNDESSLAVNGVTLWLDPVGTQQEGALIFANPATNLSLAATGTIKKMINGDVVLTTTRALDNRITTLENTPASGITIHTEHQSYADNTSITEPQLFKAGFDIAADKTITLDLALPVSGNINLGGSGTLQMAGDLYLDSQAYLTIGGIIKGEGNTLLLSSSFVIPENNRLIIGSNLVLDGQGNNLVIGNNAQLIIDPALSVTLKNLNWANTTSNDFLIMRGNTIDLTLDNVNTLFDTTFNMTQGALFIKNNVTIATPQIFAYSSTRALTVLPAAELHFDVGSTFSFSPNPTGPHTQEQRSLVRLTNQSSRLYCDHCTVELPDYGMQLTKGTILFDNKVTINGNTAAIDEQHSLEFGDGTSNNDAYVDILSGANIVVNGYMYHHPATT